MAREGLDSLRVHHILALAVMLVCCCDALHFSGSPPHVKMGSGTHKSTPTRVRRDTPVKHKTQHLNPAIEIEPLPNQRVKVAMPHVNSRDMLTFATQAKAAIDARFDQVEPAIFSSNGESGTIDDTTSSLLLTGKLLRPLGAKLEPSTAAWYMAASHKTKVVAKNISRIALLAEETTKYIVQG